MASAEVEYTIPMKNNRRGKCQMPDATRQGIVANAGVVVVKVGTNVLTDDSGSARSHRGCSRLPISFIASTPRAVESFSSVRAPSAREWDAWASANGRTTLPHLQACAAVGQSALMQAYQDCLQPHGIHTAQILLTAGDFDSRVRYLNVRNTILTLFEYNCLPDHQRERHRFHRGDQVRRQRSARRDGDEPAARAASGPFDERRRLIQQRPANRPRREIARDRRPHRSSCHGYGRREQERPGHWRNEKQAPRGPARNRGWRAGDHGQRRGILLALKNDTFTR
jgi:hypothetical protein